jgi:hypothetical protein
MKAIVALTAIMLTGIAIAEPVSNPDGTLRTIPIRVTAPPPDTTIDVRTEVDRALGSSRTITPSPLVPPPSDEDVYGRGQSFTIVNLPNGQTATAITYH